MNHLFSPFTLKTIVFKNRLVVSPMCEYSSLDGFANNWHLVHLGSRAVGGASLVFTEAAAVSPEGRISFADLGIWKNEHIEKLKEITDFIIQQGSIPGIQLAHAGRKASHAEPWNGGNQVPSSQEKGWVTYGPSNLPFVPEEESPKAMELSGIEKAIEHFRLAATRSIKAGFKVLEIHAAHGYLIHEFLSPLSNHRTDQYGGVFENRIRFLMDIINSVQTVWPSNLPLFVRISATEWIEGGWNLEDSIALAHHLKSAGVDLVDCSTGGNISGVKIPLTPGYQVPFAESIRKNVQIPTGTVGLITESGQANSLIENEKADMVFLARELLRDPYFPLRAAYELGQEIQWPHQYERGKFRAK